MKKSVLLLLAVITLASHTKANDKFEAKAQFVKWTTVPSHTDVSPLWVKNALQGKNFKDAVVNNFAVAAYKKVLGEDLYNKILAGDDSRFKMGRSRGGEINWGIGSNGEPVKMQLALQKDLWVVYFDDQPIVKWGTNGCLNALSPAPAFVDDGEDPDGQKEEVVTKKTQKEEFLKLASGPNNSQYMYNMTTSQVQSDNEKLLLGMAIRENHMLVDFAVAKDLINSKQCCNNTGGMTQMNTVAPPPNMYYMASAPQGAAQMASYPAATNVTVTNKANGWDKVNTIANVLDLGLNAYNTIHGQKVIIANGNNNGRVIRSTNPTIRDFQGSGDPYFRSTGTVSTSDNNNGGLIYNNGF